MLIAEVVVFVRILQLHSSCGHHRATVVCFQGILDIFCCCCPNYFGYYFPLVSLDDMVIEKSEGGRGRCSFGEEPVEV